MIELPYSDCAATVTETQGLRDQHGRIARKIKVLVEHRPTGAKAGDYFEGFYTDAQVEKKAQEMAQAVCRDLMIAISLGSMT